jgi:pyruvate dehydrogenase E2 component (dihydrolipoamide acetyltransferase)
MPTEVLMPQMGESIAEGTIVRWIKQVGERVDRDEPLFEISTDKVDTEVQAPASGVLLEIRAKQGETVPVNTVVAVIGEPSERPTATAAAAPGTPPAAVGAAEPPPTGPAPAAAGPPSLDELRRRKSSPLVRRIAREHGVDISQIAGTGVGGRVTKRDILAFIEHRGAAPEAPTAAAPSVPSPAVGAAPAAPAAEPGRPAPPVAYEPGARVRIEPMSVMRKKIAEHMVLSVRTSPHVYAIYEVNFDRVAKLREKYKASYQARGARLTYTAFIAKAVVDALRAFPIVNASVDGDHIVYKQDINLGIAVALDYGLIVPVVKHADEKNLLGLSRAIDDLAARARAKQLKPEEVQEGTFTITNPGVFGAFCGLPIINQPQVGILGVGAIEKRPIVVDDAIAIRPVGYLSLGHDHRLVDGADAGRFLAHVKRVLETFDESWV